MARARATETRCRIPPESSLGFLSLAGVRFTMAINLFTCSAFQPRSNGENLGDGQMDILVNRKPGEERVVLKDDATIGTGAVIGRPLRERVPKSGLNQTGHERNKGRFAGAGIANDGHEIALLDLKIDISEHPANSRFRAG